MTVKPKTKKTDSANTETTMRDWLKLLGDQKKHMIKDLDRALDGRRNVQKKVMELLEKSKGKLELALGLSNTQAGLLRLQRVYPHLPPTAKNDLMDRFLRSRNLPGITLWLTLSPHDWYRTTEVRERTGLFLISASREEDEEDKCSGVDFAGFLVDHDLIRPEDWLKIRQTLPPGPVDEESPVFQFMEGDRDRTSTTPPG